MVRVWNITMDAPHQLMHESSPFWQKPYTEAPSPQRRGNTKYTTSYTYVKRGNSHQDRIKKRS